MDKFQEINRLSKAILDEHEVNDLFKDSKNLSIYKSHYLFSLIDALKRVYPSIKKVLGEKNFNFFAKSYIEKTPSTSSNIDNYGKDFPHFLKQREELAEIHFLFDIARLDLFYFEQSEESILLSSGILKLWEKIALDEDLTEIEIDNDIMEEIKFHLEDDQTFLKARTLKDV